MTVRRIFALANNFIQGDEVGICTVASLQWAKTVLQRGRGIGSFDELGLDAHQLNALMAVWRRFDASPDAQTTGMGLTIVGADIAVDQFIDVQRHVNLTAPHVCIFWNSHHTMGYSAGVGNGPRTCEFFDMECGLFVADSDFEIRGVVLDQFRDANYDPIEGMRIVTL